MDSYIIYLILFSIILISGQLFQHSTIPLALILVITGMLLSFIPFFPDIALDPKLVLNVFLPLLVYQISAFSSWAGIRGGISLAAALAIPSLVLKHDNLDLRDLVVFLVFSVIFVTLIIQGLSLPYVLKKLGIDRIGRSERYKEHLSELQTRVHMLNAALQWLNDRKTGVKNEELLQELTLHINDYQLQKTQLELRVLHHKHCSDHDEQLEQLENLALLTELVDVQKEALLTLWRENKINLRTRNKLITILDHHIAHHTL